MRPRHFGNPRKRIRSRRRQLRSQNKRNLWVRELRLDGKRATSVAHEEISLVAKKNASLCRDDKAHEQSRQAEEHAAKAFRESREAQKSSLGMTRRRASGAFKFQTFDLQTLIATSIAVDRDGGVIAEGTFESSDGAIFILRVFRSADTHRADHLPIDHDGDSSRH
jgi:hypothetical protein